MKRLKFHRAIVAIAMMLIGWLPSLAHDFEINGVFYNVISTTEVEVTYKGSSYDEFYDEYNGDIVIPSSVNYNDTTYSVTSIGEGAFYYCDSLTSIEIGNSVTSIGASAFSQCDSLISIEIPNSVTSIGDEAFDHCDSLISIEIPNSVTSIGYCAFYECLGLTSIEIPNSVTWIGDEAFEDCESLTKITCWATTPPAIYSNTFSNYSAELYVPVGCKSAYQSAIYWRNFNIINDTLDNPITLNDNDAMVAAVGDNIVVKNATAGSVVRVYVVDGAMIASEVATEGDVIIEAPAKGIYIVAVDGKSFKVMVK